MSKKQTLYEAAQSHKTSLDELMLQYNGFLKYFNNTDKSELIFASSRKMLLCTAEKIALRIGSKASTRTELRGMFAEMGVDPKVGFDI